MIKRLTHGSVIETNYSRNGEKITSSEAKTEYNELLRTKQLL